LIAPGLSIIPSNAEPRNASLEQILRAFNLAHICIGSVYRRDRSGNFLSLLSAVTCHNDFLQSSNLFLKGYINSFLFPNFNPLSLIPYEGENKHGIRAGHLELVTTICICRSTGLSILNCDIGPRKRLSCRTIRYSPSYLSLLSCGWTHEEESEESTYG